MIAAYAIALQALLGAVLVAETANADPFVICLSAENGAPADHKTHALQHDHCVLCTGVVHSAPAPQAVALGTPTLAGAALVWHRPDWRAPAPPTTLVARPRGPPLAA